MENDIQMKIDELTKKIDAIYISVEKTRKYFLIVMWVSVIDVVLPIFGLLFAIPAFLKSYSSSFDGLL